MDEKREQGKDNGMKRSANKQKELGEMMRIN